MITCEVCGKKAERWVLKSKDTVLWDGALCYEHAEAVSRALTSAITDLVRGVL